ncbi:MAG: hypothetical protein IKH88_18335 [Prevotella sp.]|nr:hypothetical protein [Prevotella sp.]
MENNDYEDDFIINLSIEGSSFEEVEVKVEDPNRNIRDLINNIVREFELPKMDNGGAPIEYMLGQVLPDEEEPKIFHFEDEDGYELCLLDYDVKPGDHLSLVRNIIAG